MGRLVGKSWNTGHLKISAPFLTRILERAVRQLHASSLNTHLPSVSFYSCGYIGFQFVAKPVARGDHCQPNLQQLCVCSSRFRATLSKDSPFHVDQEQHMPVGG